MVLNKKSMSHSNFSAQMNMVDNGEIQRMQRFSCSIARS